MTRSNVIALISWNLSNPCVCRWQRDGGFLSKAMFGRIPLLVQQSSVCSYISFIALISALCLLGFTQGNDWTDRRAPRQNSWWGFWWVFHMQVKASVEYLHRLQWSLAWTQSHLMAGWDETRLSGDVMAASPDTTVRTCLLPNSHKGFQSS